MCKMGVFHVFCTAILAYLLFFNSRVMNMKRIFMVLLSYVSGADILILRELPARDRRPYAWQGLRNLLILGFFAILSYTVVNILLKFPHDSIHVPVVVMIWLFATCIQLCICHWLINSWNFTYKTLYIVWGGIVTIAPPAILFGSLSPRTFDLLIELFYLFVQAFLFMLSYSSISQNKDGFYDKLREKKMEVLKRILDKERREVLESFETNSELELSARSADVIRGVEEEERELLRGISSSKDVKSLAAYAEFQLRMGDLPKSVAYYDKAIELDPGNRDLWQKKIEVLTQKSDTQELQKAIVRYNELFNADQWKENLSRQIVLKNIELSNVSFYGSFTWHLRNNINILLGKNGYGKSHLLSIVLAMLQDEEAIARRLTQIDSPVSPITPFVKVKLSSDHPSKEKEMLKIQEQIERKIGDRNASILRWKGVNKEIAGPPPPDAKFDVELADLLSQLELKEGVSVFNRTGIRNSYGKIPILAIPDSRSINRSLEYTLPVADEKTRQLLENGAYHFIVNLPYEYAIQNFLNTLAARSIDEPRPERKFDGGLFRMIGRVFRTLTGQEIGWKDVRRSQDNSGYIITVRTEGMPFDLPIQKVSQGALSVLAIFGLIYHYLSLRYPDVTDEDLTARPAIVFIDEIDAHLHPSWQQKIIKLLRDIFPNIQFIITAHSPLVVMGCKEEEVAVLRKRAEGFAIETIDANLIGRPVADVYRLVFEIEEKDGLYLELAALLPFRKSIEEEYNLLRGKTSRSTGDEKRLTELEHQMEKFRYIDRNSVIMDGFEEKEKLNRESDDILLELKRINGAVFTGNPMPHSYKTGI